MHMKKTFIILCMAAALAISSSMAANAQETVAMPFSAIPVSASYAAKAGIGFTENTLLTGKTLDVSAGYMTYSPSYNPSTFMNIDAEYCLNQKIAISLEGVYGMGKAYDLYNPSGLKSGTHKPSQMLISVGAGYRILDFLSARVNLKYMTDKPAPEASYGAFGADIAVDGMFQISENGKAVAEFGVFSLGSKVTSASGVKFGIPSSVRLAGGYLHDFNEKNSISVLAQADYYLHKAFSAAVAAEAMFADIASVRVGYNLGAKHVMPSFASVGAGVHFKGVKIDVAYLLGNSPIANTLAVSLGYCF